MNYSNEVSRFSKLKEYVNAGETELLTQAIEKNPGVLELRDEAECTLLSYAITAENVYATSLFLNHGADPNARFSDSYSYLHLAIERGDEGNVAIGKLLLDYGARLEHRSLNDWTPLHHAASRGLRRFVQLLLQYHPDVNARTRIDMHETPLMEAVARSQDSVIVQLLLDNGADPELKNTEGQTPLDIAVAEGNQAIIELLRKQRRKGENHIL